MHASCAPTRVDTHTRISRSCNNKSLYTHAAPSQTPMVVPNKYLGSLPHPGKPTSPHLTAVMVFFFESSTVDAMQLRCHGERMALLCRETRYILHRGTMNVRRQVMREIVDLGHPTLRRSTWFEAQLHTAAAAMRYPTPAPAAFPPACHDLSLSLLVTTRKQNTGDPCVPRPVAYTYSPNATAPTLLGHMMGLGGGETI